MTQHKVDLYNTDQTVRSWSWAVYNNEYIALGSIIWVANFLVLPRTIVRPSHWSPQEAGLDISPSLTTDSVIVVFKIKDMETLLEILEKVKI